MNIEFAQKLIYMNKRYSYFFNLRILTKKKKRKKKEEENQIAKKNMHECISRVP